MDEFETLADALHAAAETDAQITFVEGAEQRTEVPVGELRRDALVLLGSFQRSGLKPGDELIVHVTDNRRFLEAFWACILGGFVPVPLALGISDEHRLKLVRVFERLANPRLYTDEKTLARLDAFAGEDDAPGAQGFKRMREQTILCSAGAPPSGAPGIPVNPSSDDLAFIQFSSGSTSEPKGVMLTHRNVLTNVRAIIAGAGLNSSDKTLSWMPLSHDMGMIGFHLTPLLLAGDQVLIPTDLFVRRPAIWVLSASETGATLLCSPNFGYKHLLKALDRRDPGALDLSRVRLIFNGAEPISVGLCAEFLDRMAVFGLRPESMFPVYGLAEASVAVSFPPVGAGVGAVHVRRSSLAVGAAVEVLSSTDEGVIRFARVGKPVPNCEVRITGDDGASLPEGIVGHVEIRGGNVTAGYYRDAESTGAAMRDGGWLDTGDLGFIDTEGLVITGRHKDIIFSNGQNFFPHDLEGILERECGVELGKIAVAGYRAPDAEADDVLVFVVHKGDLDAFVPLAGSLTATLNAQMGIDVTHVVPIARIPKTTSGKAQRARLAASFADGEFRSVLDELTRLQPAEVGQANEPDLAPGSSPGPAAGPAATGASIHDQLLELCRSILPDRNVGPEDNLFEIGTSSVELAQIHEGIEKAFPGLVDITDLFDYPTAAELAAFLQGKVDAS